MPFYANNGLLQECNAFVCLYFSFLLIVCFVRLCFALRRKCIHAWRHCVCFKKFLKLFDKITLVFLQRTGREYILAVFGSALLCCIVTNQLTATSCAPKHCIYWREDKPGWMLHVLQRVCTKHYMHRISEANLLKASAKHSRFNYFHISFLATLKFIERLCFFFRFSLFCSNAPRGSFYENFVKSAVRRTRER